MSTSHATVGSRRITTAMVVAGHEVPCILDTGAMTCCVPDTIMRDIRRVVGNTVKSVGTVNVGGAVSHTTVPAYVAPVGIQGLEGFDPQVEILGLPSDPALLGFNLFSLLAGIDINFDERTVTFETRDGKDVTHAH